VLTENAPVRKDKPIILQMPPSNDQIKTSPLDIAAFFIEESKEDGVTNLKLNKLIYLAHGYYWGNFQNPLITDGELAEAWKYGPVYRSVRNVFGAFKSGNVPPAYAAISMDAISSDEEVDFLNQFWQTFKNASAWYLVKMLHEKGSPWDIVWNHQRGKRSTGSSIPDYLTRAYYTGQVRELEKANGSA